MRAINRAIMVSDISVMAVTFTAKTVRGTATQIPFTRPQIPRMRRIGIRAIRRATMVSAIFVIAVVFTASKSSNLRPQPK